MNQKVKFKYPVPLMERKNLATHEDIECTGEILQFMPTRFGIMAIVKNYTTRKIHEVNLQSLDYIDDDTPSKWD